MIPAPRDPRMERDAAPEASEPVFLRVPDASEPWTRVGGDEVPESPVRLPSMVLLVLAVALGALLLHAWPSAAAYPAVLQQNLELKAQLQMVDGRMAEVERMMMRLQLYDAKLRSLSEASGDHGPLPEQAMQGFGMLRHLEDPEQDGGGAGAIDEEDLDPAESWANDVAGRMEQMLDVFELGEADLGALMAELEGLRAVRDALPGVWPTDGRMTSGFGWRRDPVRGSTKFHSGLDIAGDRGTAIYAVSPGRVVKAESTSGYGRVVEVDHGFGILTRYAHCTTLRVREGERVERGDYIATMGSTGRSTGPHLHFELRIDGNAVDPLKYLPR